MGDRVRIAIVIPKTTNSPSVMSKSLPVLRIDSFSKRLPNLKQRRSVPRPEFVSASGARSLRSGSTESSSLQSQSSAMSHQSLETRAAIAWS
ncbi:hypothetical protein M407DRAFT_174673 [Tulasnella calospora MUT 4182]|uniref:Uncharacterized protein n=1 Tax=Tulasnella calospora MUT 4182 TaxID=1051891 RepID=A0A0C3QP27_9AGAM|nr:hypothetical protein M407DRAFT_174673 [Tulasnella calospora MUT 4182]